MAVMTAMRMINENANYEDEYAKECRGRCTALHDMDAISRFQAGVAAARRYFAADPA